MLKLYRFEKGAFRQYLPSSQTHCRAIDVEQWIQEGTGDDGVIANVSVTMHGTRVPVSHAMEAYVLAALYAADHNDYVTRNFGYHLDTPANSPVDTTDRETPSESDNDSESNVDDAMQRMKLEYEFEQNETLTVHEFGPSHAADTDW